MKAKAPHGKRIILHLIDALNVGGAQELLALLAEKTPKSDYQTLVCVIQPDTTVKSRIESADTPVYCFGRVRPSIYNPIKFIVYACLNIRDIITICRRHDVDVVHCHLSDAEFLGIPAGRLYGADRVISTVHYPALLPERAGGDLRNTLRIAFTRLLYRMTDTVIAVSEDTAQQLKSVFDLAPEKIRVIINGIDVEKIHNTLPKKELLASLGLANGQRIILAVGRLMPPKGHRHLIEALPCLAKRFPNLKLLLAGDGDLRLSLEDLSRRLDVGSAVSFLGNRNDIHDILALADIFVLPSTSEGTSLALLEAMAAQKPIVATDIPGNSAVLKHAHNCILVPPENPEKLSEAVAFLLDHPLIAADYGQNAYQDISCRFDINTTISQLANVWG